MAAIQSNIALDWIKEILNGFPQEVNMVEYLVKYTVDAGIKINCECTVIAKSITHALNLVDTYVEQEWPNAKTHEICSCEFVKRIDMLLIEKP